MDVEEQEQVSITVEDEEITFAHDDDSAAESVDSSVRSNSDVQFGFSAIEESSREYEVIRKCFLKGLGVSRGEDEDTDVVAIRGNSDWTRSLTGQARTESFRIFAEAVGKKRGGNANVKYAWYGGSREEICSILSHGFSRCTEADQDGHSYGFGLYLSPANFAFHSVSSCVVDKNGLSHLLLCRVILGNQEMVSPGSKQSQPSSKEFDSGVDNLSAPRRYIIWSAYMNSHILPSYIISFRIASVRGPQRIPKPVVKFPVLLSSLSRFLPRSRMVLLGKYHNEYRENKLSKIHLIQRLRQLAGDDLLLAVIKTYRHKQLEAITRSSLSPNLNATRRYRSGA